MPATWSRQRLLGRGDECALLDGLLKAVRDGDSRTLVLRGEAGVGKSALLAYLLSAAPDMTAARTVGVESEMELAFASLHQMCSPLLGYLGGIPAPQREALEVVFGLRVGAAPDLFLVGLAVLSLLCAASEQQPLLCIVDDAQWLDRASVRTLAFVARRLLADPVGLIFAARVPGEELRGLPELTVRGLRDDDARALLTSAAHSMLNGSVRDRLIAEIKGNPLALLELPRGLSPSQMADGVDLFGHRALLGSLVEGFERRLDGFPPDTRRLLQLAAAEPLGDPALLWRAADRIGVAPGAAAPAEDDGLLRIGARVAFRHPLVRSAVYRSTSTEDRRAAHLALAAATDANTDPDRRAWHLAAAASEPDEVVAQELEQSASRARARGGLAAAAAFLERSVALSVDPARRTDRALAAADASLKAADVRAATAVLAIAEAGPSGELQRARIDSLRAELAFSQSRGSDASPLLLSAAQRLESMDSRLAWETYLDAWSAALFAGRFATAGDVYDVSRAVLLAVPAPEPPRMSDLLVRGLALLLIEGRAAGVPVLQRAVAGFAGEQASSEEALKWGWLARIAAIVVWDYDSCLAVASRNVQLARETGALALLAIALQPLALALALAGDYAQAAQLIAEADAVSNATGAVVLPHAVLYLTAHRGSRSDLAPIVDKTLRHAAASGQGNVVQFVSLANAVVANGERRYRDALAPAEDASNDMPELVASMWGLCELVEAAARSGETETARDAMQRLAARNDVSGNDWGLGLEARARALLADANEAEEHYQEAIDRLKRTPLRPELGRSHLVYGEWLRRQSRRVDARAQLRAAHQLLSDVGMTQFAERARLELLATGERARKRGEQTRDEITPQERQIALLARDGLSNPEIGGRLFLSPRTVEWHLRKVYAKLGIRSRRELAARLAGASAPPSAGQAGRTPETRT